MATVELERAKFGARQGSRWPSGCAGRSGSPRVVYGGQRGPVPVAVNPLELLAVLEAGANVLINLSLTGGETPQTSLVILKELQRDPVKWRPLHADFQEISMERKIRVEVSVVVSGEPIGVKDKGGILEQSLRQLLVECLPVSIPDRIVVDVTGLDIGDVLHVRDVAGGGGCPHPGRRRTGGGVGHRPGGRGSGGAHGRGADRAGGGGQEGEGRG